MDELQSKTCTPCRGGIPRLSVIEAEQYLEQTPGWTLKDDALRIERRFEFKDFGAAMRFVVWVGELAEREGHHPDISFGWGWATIAWQTKKIGGLHENDFIMAAKTDQLIGGEA